MSDECHVCNVCGAVKHESPTLFCAPCLFGMVNHPDPAIEIVTNEKSGRSVVTMTWERK